MTKLVVFFSMLQKYVAVCILVALLRGYWSQSLTDTGFIIFKYWLLGCAVISVSGYVFLFAKGKRVEKLNVVQYIMAGLFAIGTIMIFEYHYIL